MLWNVPVKDALYTLYSHTTILDMVVIDPRLVCTRKKVGSMCTADLDASHALNLGVLCARITCFTHRHTHTKTRVPFLVTSQVCSYCTHTGTHVHTHAHAHACLTYHYLLYVGILQHTHACTHTYTHTHAQGAGHGNRQVISTLAGCIPVAIGQYACSFCYRL